ncbi:flagellin [Paracoccus alkanivorans]|uniref:Uncharacterized protein n=1 Tax=Paracoccus alkanivorans TaxID=2116655 RepID=A0A3M0M8W2_9RHOB|nr:flagellin [Paracoccus alkanivorans]RMC34196.1 hypothetical protein C9E81_13565 [Paracoccus alkanivorans]
MLTNAIGNQARAFTLQTNTARVTKNLHTLTQENASGEAADLGLHLRGNTRILNSVETRLTLIGQYQENVKDTALLLKEQYRVLNAGHETTKELASEVLVSPTLLASEAIRTLPVEAKQAFVSFVSELNSDIGGQYIFSGLAVDRPPLISGKEILGKLEDAVSGLTSTDDIFQAVSDWFDDEFLNVAYGGTTGQTRLTKISEKHFIELDANAADQVVRNQMKGLALIALAGRDAAADQSSDQIDLMRKGGQFLIDNQPDYIAYIANIGSRQASIDARKVENGAILSALKTARNDIRQVDLAKAKTALDEVKTQLEAIYLLTNILSKLKLTEYLR